MQDKLTKALIRIKYEPESDLAKNVWRALALHDKRIIRLKLWAFSAVGLISLIGLVPAFKGLLGDLTQSGFYEYLSLAFSNFQSITSYWKELALSLGESLPLSSMILSLGLIFIFFLSIRHVVKQIHKFSRLKNGQVSGGQLSLLLKA